MSTTIILAVLFAILCLLLSAPRSHADTTTHEYFTIAAPTATNGNFCYVMCADGVSVCGFCLGGYCYKTCTDGSSLCAYSNKNKAGTPGALVGQVYPVKAPTATPTP